MQVFRLDSGISFNWYFNQSEINPTSHIYKVMSDGLSIKNTTEDSRFVWKTFSCTGKERINYIPIKEKGLFVPVILYLLLHVVFAQKFISSILKPESACDTRLCTVATHTLNLIRKTLAIRISKFCTFLNIAMVT